jgi:hypothetical protein
MYELPCIYELERFLNWTCHSGIVKTSLAKIQGRQSLHQDHHGAWTATATTAHNYHYFAAPKSADAYDDFYADITRAIARTFPGPRPTTQAWPTTPRLQSSLRSRSKRGLMELRTCSLTLPKLRLRIQARPMLRRRQPRQTYQRLRHSQKVTITRLHSDLPRKIFHSLVRPSTGH